MRRALFWLTTSLFFVCCLNPTSVLAERPLSASQHPVTRMLGEKLTYDLSFLWFKRLAEGTISLTPGLEPGQYVALLEARTLGLTAFLTSHRVERIETVMEIAPDGSLRPLLQNAQTIKGEGDSKIERVRSYQFNYTDRTVLYKNRKTGKEPKKKLYLMDKEGPVYDLLSAFYNVRAGIFGPVVQGSHLTLPTFTRRGTEDISVTRVDKQEQKRQSFFPEAAILCKVLVDPESFGTKGRDIFVGFDEQMIPRRAVVKNVIGLGDARGTLRKIQNVLAAKQLWKAEKTEK